MSAGQLWKNSGGRKTEGQARDRETGKERHINKVLKGSVGNQCWQAKDLLKGVIKVMIFSFLSPHMETQTHMNTPALIIISCLFSFLLFFFTTTLFYPFCSIQLYTTITSRPPSSFSHILFSILFSTLLNKINLQKQFLLFSYMLCSSAPDMNWILLRWRKCNSRPKLPPHPPLTTKLHKKR